jgi:hypothetical protein
VAELTKLRRHELLHLAERILEQNRILQAELRNRTARLQDREVKVKNFHLLLMLLRGELRRGPKFKSMREQVDSALSWTEGTDVEFPHLGFSNQVRGVERRRGYVRTSAPDDPWTPPFDDLTFEQAAAYIDAELRDFDAEWRVSWWTSELDDFDQAMPLQLLDKGRYRELWKYVASMRIDRSRFRCL